MSKIRSVKQNLSLKAFSFLVSMTVSLRKCKNQVYKRKSMIRNNVLLRKLGTFAKNPKTLLIKILYLVSPVLGDKLYLQLLFPLKVGYRLNLNNPITFNEKLQWLKLNYKNPKLPMMVDKHEAKLYVGKLIGEEHIIPTLGVWNKFDEIDFSKLPQQFVLKTTHDQGGVVICKNKVNFDYVSAKTKLGNHLRRDLSVLSREWPYKEVKPKIIAEKYMADTNTNELRDYKFFCFDGKPELLYIASNRQNKAEGVKFDYFDLDFNNLDISQAYGKNREAIKKPKTFLKMIEFAEVLSQNLPHVRVDFYEINEQLFFGELTFFHHSGFVPFYPKEWDNKLGGLINLRK